MRTVRTQARPLWTGAARAAPVVAAALLIVAALPGPTAMAIYAEPSVVEQDYGPYTCLDGFVWREAVANDVVCVTAAVRAQTRQDNSLAAARRNCAVPISLNGGARCSAGAAAASAISPSGYWLSNASAFLSTSCVSASFR